MKLRCWYGWRSGTSTPGFGAEVGSLALAPGSTARPSCEFTFSSATPSCARSRTSSSCDHQSGEPGSPHLGRHRRFPPESVGRGHGSAPPRELGDDARESVSRSRAIVLRLLVRPDAAAGWEVVRCSLDRDGGEGATLRRMEG